VEHSGTVSQLKSASEKKPKKMAIGKAVEDGACEWGIENDE
jgi:hypothetical protein